jgi:hypothetical protein
MTWYIDLDLQSSVEAAKAEPEREKRSEVSRHIDGWIMMKASQSEASTHRGATEAGGEELRITTLERNYT